MKMVCVGKIKEKYLATGVADFTRRISKFTKLEIVEVKDEKIISGPDRIKEVEGERLLKQIKDTDFVVALDENGKEFDSREFSAWLKRNQDKHVVFVVGGALGLGNNIKKRANLILAFSMMTFPHQMARLILLEQIYRAFTIIKNIEYHK